MEKKDFGIPKNIWFLFTIIFFITVLLLIFSTSTSPLYPNEYGIDSAFFRFIGKSILNGKTVYKDIWDNKGPVFYFIQAIGALHGTRNEKISFIFIMQICSMAASIYIMDITDRLEPISKHQRLRFILLSICTFSVCFSFFSGGEAGNLTEEWSFLMICFSMYLLRKYSVNVSQNPAHPCQYAFCHGINFALLAFIRINNAISICAGIFVIGIYLIYKKQWKNIIQNILSGILGVLVITIPIFLYFVQKGALNEMLFAVFGFNFKYTGQKSHTVLSPEKVFFHFLPIVFTFIIWGIHFFRIRKLALIDAISLAIILSNAALLQLNNIYTHYFIIYVPVLFFILILYVSSKHRLEVILTVILSIIFVRYAYQVARSDIDIFMPKLPSFPTANKYMPKSERDSAIAFNVHPEIYLNTGIFPCSRFAATQNLQFSVMPEFEEEFNSAIGNTRPKWIITSCKFENTSAFIRQLIEEQYEYQFSDPLYCFYRQK